MRMGFWGPHIHISFWARVGGGDGVGGGGWSLFYGDPFLYDTGSLGF